MAQLWQETWIEMANRCLEAYEFMRIVINKYLRGYNKYLREQTQR
jgi:hypothetical protein